MKFILSLGRLPSIKIISFVGSAEYLLACCSMTRIVAVLCPKSLLFNMRKWGQESSLRSEEGGSVTVSQKFVT